MESRAVQSLVDPLPRHYSAPVRLSTGLEAGGWRLEAGAWPGQQGAAWHGRAAGT